MAGGHIDLMGKYKLQMKINLSCWFVVRFPGSSPSASPSSPTTMFCELISHWKINQIDVNRVRCIAIIHLRAVRTDIQCWRARYQQLSFVHLLSILSIAVSKIIILFSSCHVAFDANENDFFPFWTRAQWSDGGGTESKLIDAHSIRCNQRTDFNVNSILSVACVLSCYRSWRRFIFRCQTKYCHIYVKCNERFS